MSEWKETDFGKIPIHWDFKKIIDIKSDEKRAIAMGPFGSNIKAENFVERGVPVIRGTNLKYAKFVDGDFVFLTEEKADELIGSNCKAGDLVFTHRGTIGQVGLIPSNQYPRYVISQSGMKLTVNPDLMNNEFLFYFFKSEFGQYQILKYESQVGVPSISNPLTSLKEMQVPVPPLSEQTAIASFLSSLDDKIDLLQRQNATLEKMAETLFRQWFVQPIKKITNEGIELDGFSDAKFEKWIEGTVGGEWGKENSEGDFNKVVYCIRGTDIADLNTGLPEKTPIRFIKETKFKNIEPLEGDLIIEISGGTESQSTGRVCYINQDIKNLFNHPLVFSNFCRMIRVKKSEYSFFLYCYIQYLYNQDEFFNLENGSSGIKNLDYKALLFELEYPMPTEKLVLDFHYQVEPFFKKVNQNKTQIRTLTALRDTLLPKLMSGEVTIK